MKWCSVFTSQNIWTSFEPDLTLYLLFSAVKVHQQILPERTLSDLGILDLACYQTICCIWSPLCTRAGVMTLTHPSIPFLRHLLLLPGCITSWLLGDRLLLCNNQGVKVVVSVNRRFRNSLFPFSSSKVWAENTCVSWYLCATDFHMQGMFRLDASFIQSFRHGLESRGCRHGSHNRHHKLVTLHDQASTICKWVN